MRIIKVVHRRDPRTTPRAVRSAGGGVRGRCLWTHRVNPGDGGPGEGFGRMPGLPFDGPARPGFPWNAHVPHEFVGLGVVLLFEIDLL